MSAEETGVQIEAPKSTLRFQIVREQMSPLLKSEFLSHMVQLLPDCDIHINTGELHVTPRKEVAHRDILQVCNQHVRVEASIALMTHCFQTGERCDVPLVHLKDGEPKVLFWQQDGKGKLTPASPLLATMMAENRI